MPLYLARWPDGRVALASAATAIDLFNTLDTEGDITACSVKEYTEDICLMFEPKKQLYTEM